MKLYYQEAAPYHCTFPVYLTSLLLQSNSQSNSYNFHKSRHRNTCGQTNEPFSLLGSWNLNCNVNVFTVSHCLHQHHHKRNFKVSKIQRCLKEEVFLLHREITSVEHSPIFPPILSFTYWHFKAVFLQFIIFMHLTILFVYRASLNSYE